MPDLSQVQIEGTIDRINDDGTFVVNGDYRGHNDHHGDQRRSDGGSLGQDRRCLQVDGTLLASEIKGEGRRATYSGSEVKFEGLVETVNRDAGGTIVSIVVDGLTVAVEALTNFEGTLAVGSSVEVKGIFNDGVFLAAKIEADEDGEANQRGETGQEGEAGQGDKMGQRRIADPQR